MEITNHYFRMFTYLNSKYDLLLLNCEIDDLIFVVISAASPEEKPEAVTRYFFDEHSADIANADTKEIISIAESMANELVF